MKSSPSILLALALSATAAVAAEDLSASNQPTQNLEVDPTLLTLDRIFDSSEFRERGLGQYKWSKRTASYFTLDAPQTSGKGRDLVRTDAATGHKQIVVPASAFVPEGQSEPLEVESFEFSADESKLLLYTDSQRVWRRNTRGDYWVLELATRRVQKLGGNAAPATRLLVQQFNRLQNTNRVMLADAKSGAIRTVLTESDAAWLENENPVRWVDGGSRFLWLSERDGWRHAYSTITHPPVVDLVQFPGHKVVRVLADNQTLREELATLKLPTAELLKVDIGDGVSLDAWCLKPPGLNPSAKYPLLIHVYGEPASQSVSDRWPGGSGLWHWMLAQQGTIVASIENRGTPVPRGRTWRKLAFRQVGILAAQDQAAGVRALLKLWPYADAGRVGVWGWSGGGSMSLNAIFRYPDLYSTAMAVAPNASQLLYDTIYQERYMGLPQDNAENYRLGSPITHASQLRGICSSSMARATTTAITRARSG